MDPRDRHDRPLRSLRLSVTDRCNLRCAYCMPEERYAWLPRADILHFEELARLVRIFVELGVARLRLTGGEPLLRQDLPELVAMLAALPGLRDLALTTNGLRLAEQAPRLRAAGLQRVTVSLDTLQPERFRALTRRDGLDRVQAGIAAAAAAGFASRKLNMVVMRGFNDDELLPMLEFGRRHGCEVRFIEYMDVDGAAGWSAAQVLPAHEILARLGAAAGGPPIAEPGRGSAPAARYRLPGGTVFGLIASTTEPFCGACDRSRVTADGTWLRCLYARDGTDLRAPLRAGASDEELRELLRATWEARTDRGAEERLALQTAGRGALPGGEAAHRHMHVRGG